MPIITTFRNLLHKILHCKHYLIKTVPKFMIAQHTDLAAGFRNIEVRFDILVQHY